MENQPLAQQSTVVTTQIPVYPPLHTHISPTMKAVYVFLVLSSMGGILLTITYTLIALGFFRDLNLGIR